MNDCRKCAAMGMDPKLLGIVSRSEEALNFCEDFTSSYLLRALTICSVLRE